MSLLKIGKIEPLNILYTCEEDDYNNFNGTIQLDNGFSFSRNRYN